MMIHTTNGTKKYGVRESIFDTKTGLRYDLQQHVLEYAIVAEDNKTEDQVHIYSVHDSSETSYGISYEGEEATLFWKHLIETAESMVE